MKSIINLFVLILLSFSISAAPEIIDDGLDAVFLPLIDIVRPFFVKLSFVVGGLFGATLLLVFARIYYDRKSIKLLKAIKFDLDQMNKHNGIRYSYEQSSGFYQRLIRYLEDRAHRKALKQLHKMRSKKDSLGIISKPKVMIQKLKKL